MDDETKQRFDALMQRMNDGFESVLDQISAMRADTDNTRGHVLYGLQENLTLSQRITKVEEELRRLRP